MKALTLQQPWATLVASGRKTIETRSWSTRHRGPIAIHAGKTVPSWVLPLNIGGFTVEKDNPRGTEPSYLLRGLNWPYRLPLGAIVATANLVGCLPIVDAVPIGEHDRRELVVQYLSGVNGTARLCLLQREVRGGESLRDLSDQLPYGEFTARPRYAWLLDDIQRTTERCPGCNGLGWDCCGHLGSGHACPEPRHHTCPTCNGESGCVPVPARGMQGLWNWTPS